MAITYEDINPSLIPNTTMQKGMLNGILRVYLITPVDGYVLHDKAWDSPVYDENGNETGEVILGYQTGMASCGFNYNWAENPREFFAVPAESVPTEQIHGATPSTETT
jgi:hypothetical protein